MAHKHRCCLTINYGWSPEESVDFRSKVVEIVTVGSLNIKNPISRKMLKGQTTRETGRSRRGRPNMTDEGKFNLGPTRRLSSMMHIPFMRLTQVE